MKKRIIARRLVISFCFYAFVALSVILMPFQNIISGDIGRVFKTGVGILFWIGLLGGSIAYHRLYSKCKKIIAESVRTGIPPGFIFFSNRAARGADIILIISFIANILFLKFIHVGFFVAWLGLFILITSLYFHFLLNSRVLNYILSK